MYLAIADLFLYAGWTAVAASIFYILYKGLTCFIDDKEYSSASYDIVKYIGIDDKLADKFKNFEFTLELLVAVAMSIGVFFLALFWPLTLAFIVALYFRVKKRKEKLKDI